MSNLSKLIDQFYSVNRRTKGSVEVIKALLNQVKSDSAMQENVEDPSFEISELGLLPALDRQLAFAEQLNFEIERITSKLSELINGTEAELLREKLWYESIVKTCGQ